MEAVLVVVVALRRVGVQDAIDGVLDLDLEVVDFRGIRLKERVLVVVDVIEGF